MRFAVISTGWKSWPWIQASLLSIAAQTYPDVDVCVVDDDSGDPQLGEFITDYCMEHGWEFMLRSRHYGALHNQVDAIRHLAPAPDDVIVFVDCDGDTLKHPRVLERVADHYADGTKLIYFQYDSHPFSPTCSPSRPYPPEVVTAGSYREYARTHGFAHNHLRTFRAELFYAMDESDFRDDQGAWLQTAADAALMFPALELARGSVKFVDEVMLTYHSSNPLSDWRRDPRQIDADHTTILGRQRKR